MLFIFQNMSKSKEQKKKSNKRNIKLWKAKYREKKQHTIYEWGMAWAMPVSYTQYRTSTIWTLDIEIEYLSNPRENTIILWIKSIFFPRDFVFHLFVSVYLMQKFRAVSSSGESVYNCIECSMKAGGIFVFIFLAKMRS